MTTITLPSDELSEFDLPRVCVVTGSTEGVVFKDVKFAWYPRWVGLLVLVNLLIAMIVAFALTKRVKGQLPFTEEGYRTWRRAVTMRVLSFFALIGLIFGAIWAFVGDSGALGATLILLAILAPVVGVVGTRKQVLTPMRIADGKIVLRIPSEAAGDAIREHVHAGAMIPSQGQSAA